MLLTITTTHQPATDLGYLLGKHPGRCQSFDLSFGQAHVFYPEASAECCTATLLLDVDPVGMVRGRAGAKGGGMLDQYVNDRPYAASSFLSVAIAQVYGSAMNGRCKERPELARTPIPVTATISVLPCRRAMSEAEGGGEGFLRRLFEPLGYTVSAQGYPLDEKFPQWGESPYLTVTLARTATLAELLTHLYVLVPVLDNSKHYYVGDAEVEKLLAKGGDWLASHPQRETIVRRYLKHQRSLAREALTRLAEEDQLAVIANQEAGEMELPAACGEPGRTACGEPGRVADSAEEFVSLNEQRMGAVLAALRASGAKRVLDLGCGEGHLLRELMKDKQFEQIVGLDVSIRSLEIAADKLHLDTISDRQKERIRLMHGSLMYRDKRLAGFDAAAVVEVIEHLDPPRLAAFERVLFECARPGTVVLTTPNREYNVLFERGMAVSAMSLTGVPPVAVPSTYECSPKLRHRDHRFEWTRAEFTAWAKAVADRFGYSVRFLPVGPEDPTLGPPTQMAVFEIRQ